MKKEQNDGLIWFLIGMSPIAFGALIVLLIYIIIVKYNNLNFNEDGGIIIIIYLCYCLLWARIWRKVTGTSWLE